VPETSNIHQEIVITGGGWLTPHILGSIASLASQLHQRRATVDTDQLYCAMPDDLAERFPDLPKEIRRERDLLVAAVALNFALAEAKLSLADTAPERIGIVLGCALAGQGGMIQFADEVRAQSPRFVSPLNFPQTVGNYTAGGIGRSYHIRGPSITLSCGTASGLEAIACAAEHLRTDDLDVVIAGGFDLLTASLARAMPREPFAPAEGACLFVLEKQDSAQKRGTGPIARLGRCRRVSRTETDGNDNGAVSTAGLIRSGAVCIEQCTGNALAASGASALAAAIIAGRGQPVPVAQSDSADSITILPAAKNNAPVSDWQVIAAADGTHAVSLEVTIPRGDASCRRAQ